MQIQSVPDVSLEEKLFSVFISLMVEFRVIRALLQMRTTNRAPKGWEVKRMKLRKRMFPQEETPQFGKML